MMSVFLSPLGVTHHAAVHPPSIQLWQKNRICLFTLIQVIKRCATILEIERIKVCLQCPEASALHLNTLNGLEAQSESAYLRFPMSESLVAESQARTPILMHLRPGGLKHVTLAKAYSKKTEEDPSKGKHRRQGQRLTGANSSSHIERQ
jgi:hypothetical protein